MPVFWDLGVCRRTPSSAREREFLRLVKTAKQAMLVLSPIQPDAVRRTTAAGTIRESHEGDVSEPLGELTKHPILRLSGLYKISVKLQDYG